VAADDNADDDADEVLPEFQAAAAKLKEVLQGPKITILAEFRFGPRRGSPITPANLQNVNGAVTITKPVILNNLNSPPVRLRIRDPSRSSTRDPERWKD